MHILANENIPQAAIEKLRAAGHDVVWAATHLRGQSDSKVLAQAVAEGRLVLTQDKDFGELAFRSGLPATTGVMLIRVGPGTPMDMADKIAAALATRDSWVGVFAVVEASVIRIRPLPGEK